MNLFLRVIKNSAFLVVATLLDRAGEYILVLFISRTLGVQFFGQYFLVISLLYIFQNLARVGLNQLTTREIAKRKDQIGPLVLGYGLLGSGLAVVLTGVMYLTAIVLDYPPDTMVAIYLVGLSIIPATLRSIGEGAIFAWERMELVALIRFGVSLVRVGISLALLLAGYGLLSILMVLVITEWFAALLSLAVVHWGLAALGGSVRSVLSRQSVANVGTFFVMSIFMVGVNNLDAVILSKLAPIEVVGLYGAASKLVQAIILCRAAIMNSLFPALSYLSATAPGRFQAVVQQALRLTLVVLLPAALIVSQLSDVIIPFLYKEEFLGAIAPFSVLIWIIVPSFVYAVLTRALVAGGHEKVTIAVTGLSVMVNVGLDLVLIPRWGAVGAAWATLLSLGLAAVVSYVFVTRRLFWMDFGQMMGKPLLAGLCLSVAAFVLRDLPWLPLVPILLAIYLCLLFLWRITDLNEVLILWQTVRVRLHR